VLRIAHFRVEIRTRELPKETELTSQQQTFQSIMKRRVFIFKFRPLFPSTRSHQMGGQVNHRTNPRVVTRLSGSYLKSNLVLPVRKMPFYWRRYCDSTIYSFTPWTYAILAHNSKPIKFIPHWRVFLFTCTGTGFRFNVKLSFKTENQFKSTESASSTCHLFANTFYLLSSFYFFQRQWLMILTTNEGNLENVIISVSNKH
jgi:hypothetical protein